MCLCKCYKMCLLIIMSSIGLVKCKREHLIYKGKDAPIRMFPHAAFLHAKCHIKNEPGWICGSSVINQRILLTAAHCVDSCWGKNTMNIFVGHTDKHKGTVYRVQHIIKHGDYVTKKFDYDVALIKVQTNIIFGVNVRRVAIMKIAPHFNKAFVAGWGLIKENPVKKSTTLQYIPQYVWTRRECRSLGDLPVGIFCASSEGHSFATGGDSGSALVVRGYIQIGIVSYKMPSVSKSLVIYTDTGYFYDWITNSVKKLYCFT